MDGRSWALLVALAFLWSISFIFMKVAAAEIPIWTLVLVRVSLAAIVLQAVVRASGRRFPTRPAVLARYGLMGLFNNILPGALIIFATIRIGAGAASILNATVPIFTLLIAHYVTADERITPAKLAGILLGIGGVVAMVGPQAMAGLGVDGIAVGAMLLATLCYAVSNAIGRSFAGIDPIVSATCQLTAATMMLAPFALLLNRPWEMPMPSAQALFCAAGLALASTALAYVLFFKLIARAGATNTSLVTLLIPVGGVMLAWLILGELLSWGEAAGMALIALGLIVIDGRVARRLGAVPEIRPDLPR
jgi:drug/metabolite transporter (DMT)-like permease